MAFASPPTSDRPRRERPRVPGRAVAILGLFLTRCSACTPHDVHEKAMQHHDIAIEYLKQGRCVEAEERCKLALEYGPNFEHPHNCLGMIELQCRANYDKAAGHFKDALAINPDFAEAHNNLGVCFIKRDPPDYDSACDQFKAAIEIDPGNLDGRENYGFCLMREGIIEGDKGDLDKRKELFKEARSHLIRLLELNPNNFNARHHLGLMDLYEEKYESGEQNFRRCLEIDPGNPLCCFNCGVVYLKTGRCDEAIQMNICALRGGQENEVSVGARTNLGAAYELCAKKDQAILKFLERIKSDPGSAANHFDLGNIYMEKGLTDQAVTEWENTVKLDPLYCPAYFELAMIANKNLDTAVTIKRCQDFVECTTEKNRKEPTPKWGDRIEQCKGLVRKLEMQ